MQFEKYGVIFRELQHEDIEMVRQWRNDPEVARHMISQDHITPEMQEKWFQGITRRREKHFVVNYEGRDVGLYSLKDIDLEDKSAESAMYIASQDYRNTHLAYLITLGAEQVFVDLGLKKSKIFILDENKRAIRYNKSFGYKPTDVVVDGGARLYWLDFEEYEKNVAKFKKLLKLTD